MKKSLFLFLPAIVFVAATVIAQPVTRSLNWDSVERNYLEYVPDSYNPENSAPVVFCLHGLGDNMNNFSGVGFHTVANNFGWIVITPQALMASLPLFGPIGEAWNSGAGAEGTPFGDIILNDGVDDSGFLIAILDSLENHYNVNTDSVFFMGFSLGGFMAHRMAIEHGDRVDAIASVGGTIGKFLDANPFENINVLHIHGTEDTQIGYDDAEFDAGGTYYSIGKGAEETVEYWRSFNNCDEQAIVTYFPDSMEDGLTFERYLYLDGDNNSRTALIKTIGGDHEWHYYPQNDIDYTTEIWRFLTDNMIFHEVSNIEFAFVNNVKVFPNPASDFVNIEIQNLEKSAELRIYSMDGSLVISEQVMAGNNNIDISKLSKAQYLIKITEAEIYSVIKLIVID